MNNSFYPQEQTPVSETISKQDTQFLEAVQKLFGDDHVEKTSAGIIVHIPNNWKRRIHPTKIPWFQNLLSSYGKNQEVCNQSISENIYHILQQNIFKNYDIEYNGIGKTSDVTRETIEAIGKIIDADNFQKDKEALNHKDFHSLSEEFLCTFLQVLFGEICVLEEGKKSDKKELLKAINKTPGGLKFYLNFIATDTKKEKQVSSQVTDIVLKTLFQKHDSTSTT